MDKKTKDRPIPLTDSTLVTPGKSRRLLEMRERAMTEKALAPVARSESGITESESDASPELVLVRQLIDQRLAEIFATLPAGRQKSLFKIRFGVELEEIKNLPLKRAVAILKIRHPQLILPLGNMKQTLELAYNGKQAR